MKTTYTLELQTAFNMADYYDTTGKWDTLALCVDDLSKLFVGLTETGPAPKAIDVVVSTKKGRNSLPVRYSKGRVYVDRDGQGIFDIIPTYSWPCAKLLQFYKENGLTQGKKKGDTVYVTLRA